MSKEILSTITKSSHMVYVNITLSNGNVITRTNKGFNTKATKAQAKKSAAAEVVEMFKGKYDKVVGLEYGFCTAKDRTPVLSWNDLTEHKTTYKNPFGVKTEKVHKFF
tara:strand:- start:136 stop:459 length:324 start_codon:yes stop_codon:yes gene_type:complete